MLILTGNARENPVCTIKNNDNWEFQPLGSCERVINEMKLEDESRRDELLSENDSHSEDFNTFNIMAKEHRTLTGFLDKLTLEANVPTADDDALHISTITKSRVILLN